MKFKALLVLCLVYTSTLFSQNAYIKKDSLKSEVLGEQRHLQILLPKNYKPDTGEKYAAIYLLDGPWNQELVGTIRDFIRLEKHMPSTIIVSIVNVDRNRDFLPSHIDDVPTSGGADKFLEFIKSELMPYMEDNYPVKGEDILLGHSFGGVFTMFALLEEPQLFDAYLVGDPSFWWDDGYMVDLAAEKLPSLKGTGKILFIAGRKDNNAYAGMGIDKMDSVIRLYKPDDLYWKSVAYENETHGTSRLKHAYDGLRYAYEGFGSMHVEFHPMNGIFEKGNPITVWNATGSETMRYTTDGSDPTKDSEVFTETIVLQEPGTLKVKVISPHGNFDSDIVEGKFLEGDVPRPVKKPKNVEPGGLNYGIYKGKWDLLPDFKSIKAFENGILEKGFNLDSLPEETNFACLIEGFMKIEENGNYIFVLSSDDGSRLILGDQLILDNDGLHTDEDAKTFVLPLKKGFYPIRIEYFQKGGGKSLNSMYVTPGANRSSPIPQEILFYTK